MIGRVLGRLKFLWRNTPLGKIRKSADAVTWGIIGTGYMSDTFARAIMESHHDVLLAVSSRSQAKAAAFARSHGKAKPYVSIDSMLKDANPHIIYIATPVECHYEHIKQCLEAGHNVLCEKPLVISSAQAAELFDLATRKGVLLLEGMWMHCLPTMHMADQWIECGLIGEVEYVHAELNKRLNTEHVRKHHGVMTDYGIYGVAFLNHFLGNGAELLSSVCRRDPEGNITDISLQMGTESRKASLAVTSNFRNESKAVVVGSKGSIEWNSPFNRTNAIILYDLAGNIVDCYSVRYLNEGFEFELREVNQCLKAGHTQSGVIRNEDVVKCLGIIEDIENK